MNELYWAVGELVSHVRATDNNTLIFVISDNGPALELCNGGGTAGGLKGNGLFRLPFNFAIYTSLRT